MITTMSMHESALRSTVMVDASMSSVADSA